MSKNPSKTGRWVAAMIAVIGLCAVFYNVVMATLPKGEIAEVKGYKPWPKETVKVAETIVVQDGGRTKPLAAYAGFKMLGLYGSRSMKIKDENGNVYKISPTEWVMDALFRPEFAIQEPTFRVDNAEVLQAIGLTTKGKRDRYSYTELEPGRDKLIELAKSYETLDAKKRDPVKTQTVDLAYNINNYQMLLGYLGFAQTGILLPDVSGKGGPGKVAFLSNVMMAAPEISKQLSRYNSTGDPVPEHIQSLLQQVTDAANFSNYGLFILPPSDPKNDTWRSAGNEIMNVMTGKSENPKQAIEDIAVLEDTVQAYGTSEKNFRNKLTEMRDRFDARAKSRGDYGKVNLEVSYYRHNWFLYAMIYFLLGTLSTLVMWSFGNRDRNKILSPGTVASWVTLGFTVTGLIYCSIAIVQRCLIMGRPPVGNLYDTVIFIAASSVGFSLIIELMTRRRFALGFAPIFGTLLIVLARRYEVGDATDHMDPLVAVLNSNYWLTIHVITITLGYSAGLLSAFLSCGYLLLRGLRLVGDDKSLFRAFTRTVYGCLCLTLFLSLVGTILGGIWANDSWGRFWGWDPKENGALLIVLWCLVILHARLGGYIREWGLHFCSVFTACIVGFSWWHVNFLGEGLHSYGFTSNTNTIYVFYAAMVSFVVFGVIVMAIEKQEKMNASALKKSSPVGSDELIDAEG
ncbi:cytochrome c biogenesis protein CcsA [Luteolibacter pohnpeiensis]|uniref:Cytochrome c biogenesis protein CcsA n=1 Tax=Luteolibacter pohnpeiensis TaxID=454153 RepID=A0A934VTS5_9BACT|nr:cytochrome c biogenesis protein CcsA [Luteolibacter pohnpeiensis]MBK1881782.1 cytochrome c biogenesis protein CcsA [Luteolibacter pohnpeiensis]